MLSKNTKYDGIAVALAWPETFCKQANSWYDLPMRWLGFSKDFYYQAGHAAVLLVEKNGRKCHYFDFGRYHSPFSMGRVRSDQTDPELEVSTKPEFFSDGEEILNIRDILFELQSNASYHGDGRLYASQFPINFESAYQKAIELQSKVFIPYGPFIANGSNCSRFVSSVIAAGHPPLVNRIKLKYFVPTTPTTLSNVKAGKHPLSVPKLSALGEKVKVVRPNYRDWANSLNWLNETFPQPVKHINIPQNAQWLSGEGYGSWYAINVINEVIHLSKFSPKGVKEHSTQFIADSLSVDFSKPYSIAYPTNNLVLTIIQQDEKFSFTHRAEEKHVSGQVNVG